MAMMDSSERIPKAKLEVEIELDDGRSLAGALYITPQGRLTDLLNDKRLFLPFERSDGTFTTLAKTSIRMVTPLAREKGAYQGKDPFRVLGVADNVGAAELKQAYHRLCAENHPDRLRGMGLSEEFIEMANVRMARINEAYQQLAKRFREEATPQRSGADVG
jgi:DnaJ-domain-containing protein 1